MFSSMTRNLLLFLAITPIAYSGSHNIKDTWLTQKESKNAQIEIKACPRQPEKVCGEIVWLESQAKTNTPLLDQNNEDPALRNRPLMHLMLLQDFIQRDETTWEEGTIYNPEDGKTYACTMRLTRDDAGQEVLRVRGHIGIELFGKSQDWVRLSSMKAGHKAEAHR